MNCLLVMKIKWSLDINTGAVERSEAARARRLAGATVVGPVTARADQLWHAETGPPDQIWRRTNYCVTGPLNTMLIVIQKTADSYLFTIETERKAM